MAPITHVHGRQILDSRGNPTVEVEVTLDGGEIGRAAVPSGASTGEFEATELRDGGERWGGKGVGRAVANVNGEIAAALTGADPTDQAAIDRVADRARRHRQQVAPRRQRDPRRLAGGGAGVVARRRAAALPLPRAASTESRAPSVLPVPMMNVVNGGAHADNSVDFQEFMVVPAGAESFSECLRWGTEVFHALKGWLKVNGLNTAVGDEGGFAPDLSSNEAALEALVAGISAAGYEPGSDVFIALDPATSEIFEDGAYDLAHESR